MKKLILATLAIGVFSAAVYAGKRAPEKWPSFDSTAKLLNPLEVQVGAVTDHELRGRTITFAPGATSSEHVQTARSGMAYVMVGTVTGYKNGQKIEYRQGDTWADTADTIYMIENLTSEPAKIFMVDLPT